MSSGVATGAVGLVGAIIGGGFSLGGQWIADRRARRKEAGTEHRRYISALRLMVMDLERSLRRLQQSTSGDPRGFMELPRGAWIEYRSLLAPYLDGVALELLIAAHNEIVEWNTVLWAAFGESSPPTFHRADQHRLTPAEAAALLETMRPALQRSIEVALDASRVVRDREAPGITPDQGEFIPSGWTK
jgi:hypothetical protein